MKMKEIELSPFVKTKSCWGGTYPYTIAFVYSPDGNCIVKGMSKDVRNYIETHFPRCIYYYTYWFNGQCRGSWRSPLALYFTKEFKSKKYVVDMNTKNGWMDNVISFRRVPRKWLDIYNQAIKSTRI